MIIDFEDIEESDYPIRLSNRIKIDSIIEYTNLGKNFPRLDTRQHQRIC